MDQNLDIVGVAGLPRSGKDTVAGLLIQHNYYGFSFGDFIRRYSLERHKDKSDPISVANMTETSNWLRETLGPDVVLQAALKEFSDKQTAETKYKGLVLYSVRAPVEVDWILNHHGKLIWIEANEEIRYKRNIHNLRVGEAKISLEEFKRQEALQWQPQPGVPAEAQMDLAYVKRKATITISNNSDDVEAFKREAKKALGI